MLRYIIRILLAFFGLRFLDFHPAKFAQLIDGDFFAVLREVIILVRMVTDELIDRLRGLGLGVKRAKGLLIGTNYAPLPQPLILGVLGLRAFPQREFNGVIEHQPVEPAVDEVDDQRSRQLRVSAIHLIERHQAIPGLRHVQPCFKDAWRMDKAIRSEFDFYRFH
jgi:hypothetical protein